MTAESDGTARSAANTPVPDTGSTSGEDVDEDGDTWQSLLVAQVLVAIVAVGYGAITGNWPDAWEIIGGCLMLAVAASAFFQVRKVVRRRRADRAPGAPGD